MLVMSHPVEDAGSVYARIEPDPPPVPQVARSGLAFPSGGSLPNLPSVNGGIPPEPSSLKLPALRLGDAPVIKLLAAKTQGGGNSVLPPRPTWLAGAAIVPFPSGGGAA